MTQMQKLAIIRLPDDNGERVLIKFPLLGGKLIASPEEFTVVDGDSYQELSFSQVVMATPIMGGSYEEHRLTVKSEDGTLPILYELPPDELLGILSGIFADLYQ